MGSGLFTPARYIPGPIDSGVQSGALLNEKSMLFDGVDEFIDMGDVIDIDKDEAASISIWFKSSDTSNHQYLIAKRKIGGTPSVDFSGGWSIRIQPDGKVVAEWLAFQSPTNNAMGKVTNVGGYNDGGWHHLVVTKTASASSNALAFIIDGVSVAASAIANSLTATTITDSSLALAARVTGGTPSSQVWHGNLDEATIWDKALSVLEAQELYNNGIPPLLTNVSFWTNFTAGWRLGDLGTFPIISDIGSSGYDGTAINMESGDVVSDVPS